MARDSPWGVSGFFIEKRSDNIRIKRSFTKGISMSCSDLTYALEEIRLLVEEQEIKQKIDITNETIFTELSNAKDIRNLEVLLKSQPISNQVLRLIDMNHRFSKSSELFPAYESIHGGISQGNMIALEGIKSVLKTILEKIMEMLKAIGRFILWMFGIRVKRTERYRKKHEEYQEWTEKDEREHQEEIRRREEERERAWEERRKKRNEEHEEWKKNFYKEWENGTGHKPKSKPTEPFTDSGKTINAIGYHPLKNMVPMYNKYAEYVRTIHDNYVRMVSDIGHIPVDRPSADEAKTMGDSLSMKIMEVVDKFHSSNDSTYRLLRDTGNILLADVSDSQEDGKTFFLKFRATKDIGQNFKPKREATLTAFGYKSHEQISALSSDILGSIKHYNSLKLNNSFDVLRKRIEGIKERYSGVTSHTKITDTISAVYAIGTCMSKLGEQSDKIYEHIQKQIETVRNAAMGKA